MTSRRLTPARRALRVVAAAALAGAGAPAALASQSPASATGRIVGAVHDSLLAGGPLADAEVWIDGTTLSARADAQGRFRLDSVPAGRHRVTFAHPSLAAQRIGAPVATVVVPAHSEATVLLATPAGALVHRALCPRDVEPRTGVLLGLLAAVGDTSASATPGPARVMARWVVYSIAPRGGLVRTPREVAADADAEGAFRLCGVPNDLPVEVRAEGRGGATSVAEVSFREREVAFARLALPVVAEAPGGADGSPAPTPGSGATIRGTVRAPDGRPASGVSVHVLDAADTVASARTGDDGGFLVAAPARALVVEARAIGFRPVRLAITTVAGRVTPVALALGADASGTVLAATRVVEARTRASSMLAGFEQRRGRGTGRFVTRDDLERWRPGTTLEAVAMVPGVRLVPDNSSGTQFGQTLISIPRALTGPLTNASCRAAIYVDGVRWSTEAGQPLETLIRPQELHGIEVHSTLAGIPAEFAPMNSGCGVVLIWTRRGRDR